MKPFKRFYKIVNDPASINNTTTKQVSYRYTPTDYANSNGNSLANAVGTESEEKIEKIKDLKKKINDK